ncbi:MAG: N-acetyltransferase [Robiginitomaculum sp.]|nr:MAG: N-acetyltransferase [Robiginitomaculum sp.]
MADPQSNYFCHESSYIDDNVTIGDGTKIWHFCHILPGTTIGKNCSLGQNVMAGPDVIIGNGCKIQNNVALYKGVVLEDGVFCGPSMVFTNVTTPRSEVNRQDEYVVTLVRKGVTIGANATIVCGHELGEYCFIGAGAVVTKDVKPHAVMAGVPAKQIGWVAHSGEMLRDDLKCPRTGDQYEVVGESLVRKS